MKNGNISLFLLKIYKMPSVKLTIEQVNSKKPVTSMLIALEYVESKRTKDDKIKTMILCLCNCGKTCIQVTTDFVRGNPLSCGCMKKGRKRVRPLNLRLYEIWRGIKNRVKDKSNKYYGAKGCELHPDWYDFDVFEKWSLNNGYSEEKYLDKDILGNGLLYSQDTCKWVTPFENNCNRSTSVKYDYNGEQLTLSQIAPLVNIPYHKLKSRIYMNKKTLQESISMGL